MPNPSLAQTQTPPAKTYQPGFWQPVNRIHPKGKIGIQVVNQSQYQLELGLTEDKGFTRVAPGETTRVYTEPLPIYLVIYPVKASRAILKFDIAVTADNQLIVTVRKAPPGSERNSSINIDETGAIYIS